nr:hypothetical protein [uncultured Flavobacterium sp.]
MNLIALNSIFLHRINFIRMALVSDLTTNILFETEKGYSYQCDLTNSIIINFTDTVSSYKIHDFLIFQRKVNSVDILDMLYDLSDHADVQLIETTKRNFSRNLTICEIVQLRELLNGTKFTLNLHSMLCNVLNVELI